MFSLGARLLTTLPFDLKTASIVTIKGAVLLYLVALISDSVVANSVRFVRALY